MALPAAKPMKMPLNAMATSLPYLITSLGVLSPSATTVRDFFGLASDSEKPGERSEWGVRR